MLSRHIWSFAGDDDRQSVSETLLRPSVAYTFSNQTTLDLVSEATYDWQTEQWNVPLDLCFWEGWDRSLRHKTLSYAGQSFVYRSTRVNACL